MDWNLMYDELSSDDTFVNTCENLKKHVIEIESVLEKLQPYMEQYDTLPLASQIEVDLFLAYTNTSLHWAHLRIQGVDVKTHPINDEITRINAAMRRWKEVSERDMRPKVNVEAAKRFVRSGLYDPSTGKGGTGQNKITKFED